MTVSFIFPTERNKKVTVKSYTTYRFPIQIPLALYMKKVTCISHKMKAKGRMTEEKGWGEKEKEINGNCFLGRHQCRAELYWLCFLSKIPRGCGNASPLRMLLYSAGDSRAQGVGS